MCMKNNELGESQEAHEKRKSLNQSHLTQTLVSDPRAFAVMYMKTKHVIDLPGVDVIMEVIETKLFISNVARGQRKTAPPTIPVSPIMLMKTQYIEVYAFMFMKKQVLGVGKAGWVGGNPDALTRLLTGRQDIEVKSQVRSLRIIAPGCQMARRTAWRSPIAHGQQGPGGTAARSASGRHSWPVPGLIHCSQGAPAGVPVPPPRSAAKAVYDRYLDWSVKAWRS